MADGEDLDLNPFYKSLQTKFSSKFETAQDRCYLLCIPVAASLKGIYINQQFVETHVLRPSPYFQSHFVSSDKHGSRSIVLENGHIHTKDGFPTNTAIKILSEELGYNKDYKPFKMLIIEKPLDSTLKSREDPSSPTLDLQETRISFQDNKRLLFQFPEHKTALAVLDQNIRQFNSNYMILQGYLDHAAQKLKDICFHTTENLLKVNRHRRMNSDRRIVDLITNGVESYVMGSVHGKVFQAVCQKCAKDDEIICQKVKEFHGIRGEEFGVKPEFCCPLPASIVELANLDGLTTPLEKVSCLKATLDNISEEVNDSLRSNSMPGDELPCLTSDDLISILITLLIQAKSRHLASNLYYMEHFHWSTSSKDDLSFSLVTFKAAAEYFINTDFSYLKPLTPKVKNEMTFEEIIAVKQEQEGDDNKDKTNKTRPSTTASPRPRLSSFNRELDNITRMIEKTSTSSTDNGPIKSLFPEYDQVQASGFGKRTPTSPPDVIPISKSAGAAPLGDFLSSLQNDLLDGTYGKQD
ncbi:ankyrin repeat domain-containing protein 27-like [Ptychodera flava]|uniref:ankyrin repeat domain-containing protein 27-like n=1 Tax=Ptychodera flava TaxID=63121 RepID=UPI00396A29A3